jgi:LysM repeat protein
MSENNQNKNVLGVFIGIAFALFLCLIVVGGFLLAFSEGGVKLGLPSPQETSIPTSSGPQPTPTSPSELSPTKIPTQTTLPTRTTSPSSPSPTLTSTSTESSTATSSVTSTPLPTPSPLPPATLAPTFPPQPPPECGPSASWTIYIVQPGDTLYRIGQAYGVTVDQLIFANCLVSTTIHAGQQLWVPNVAPQFPTATITNIPAITSMPPPTSIPISPPAFPDCGPPASWTIYIVQPGDTLQSIASAYFVTVTQLMYANCLSSTAISPGQQLWVPNTAPNSLSSIDTLDSPITTACIGILPVPTNI